MTESVLLENRMNGKSERLVSLDVFRGLTIIGMILVNNPGSWSSLYSPLRHAHWDGWTPTDLIFPFFLWIAGFSLTLSVGRRLERGEGRLSLSIKIFRRALLLLLMGLMLAAFPFGLLPLHHFSFDTWRFPGVLQRIAVCYFFAAMLFLHLRLRYTLLLVPILFIIYYILMSQVPVPGYGAGVWTPEGNIDRWVDTIVFGSHTWSGSPADGFDPEGIVSTIGALLTILMGVLSGVWLNRKAEHGIAIFIQGVAAGTILLLSGLFLDRYWPINKNLWSGSYVLLTSGLALLTITFLFMLEGKTSILSMLRMPLVYGRNAIFSFVFAGILARILIYSTWSNPVSHPVSFKNGIYEFLVTYIPRGELSSLVFALLFTALFFPLLFWMDRRGIYLKV